MESRGRLALHWKILIGLVIGAVAGLTARAIWPPGADIAGLACSSKRREPVVASVTPNSAAATAGVEPGDRIAKIDAFDVTTRNEAIDRFHAYRRGDAVDVVFQRGGESITLREQLPPDFPLSANRRLDWFAVNIAETVGQIFLRLIFMVVVPLVFSALVLGVAEIGDVRKLGRMGLRTLLMTLILSGASVAIGLTLANTVRPGTRLPEATRSSSRKSTCPRAPPRRSRRSRPRRCATCCST